MISFEFDCVFLCYVYDEFGVGVIVSGVYWLWSGCG